MLSLFTPQIIYLGTTCPVDSSDALRKKSLMDRQGIQTMTIKCDQGLSRNKHRGQCKYNEKEQILGRLLPKKAIKAL